ncbi:hypothetical protein ACOTC8_27960 [Achromobacter xylosoxidans]|uniref:hypothetical protein n=1 Tax=Alcaligenes xylosoxydans xylosoxydans TaxID=85698 RepID=UPI0012D760FE|nr:hypothetical protein [Achromobacter xylosoxidans]MCH1995356.1 hypothetical protein [Achromobacter xylosoxidans]
MPISKLCQEYGLSDNGLRKLCLRLKVPVPERGYWAKKAVGKARAKPQLPVLADMPESAEVAVTTSDESTPSLAMRAETKATLKQDQKFEQDVGHRVEVGGLPMHKALVPVQKRLVQRMKDWENARKKYEVALNRRNIRSWEPNWSVSKLYWPSFEENGKYLFLRNERTVVHVTEQQVTRSLEILNALLHAAPLRGYVVRPPEPEAAVLTLKRRGFDTLLRLTEQATIEEIKDSSIYYAHKGGVRKQPRPTGILRIHFRLSTRTEKFVSDEDGPLEEQLNELFAKLAKAEAAYAEHLHREAIQAKLREEAQARWVERQQRLEEERKAQQLIETQLKREKEERESFLRDLCAEADAWRKSQSVACYLRHLREASGDSASGELREWLSRAEEALSELDPTTRRLRS